MNLATLLDAIRSGADVFGQLRYGVPTSEKERIALTGALPGAPAANKADPAEAERYASGYLFQKEHPVLASTVQPMVDRVRLAWFGDSPELQSYAHAGANAARIHEVPPGRQSLATLLGLAAGGR
jgi:hypothetical protein